MFTRARTLLYGPDRNKWYSLLITVMHLQVPLNAPKRVYVRSAVDKVAMGQVSTMNTAVLYCHYYSTSATHSFITVATYVD
jgi:hypothetical protein